MSTNSVQILGGQPMTPGYNTRSRKARRQPKRKQGSGKSNPKNNKKKGKKQPKNQNPVFSEIGACGALYLKALQNPFHFANSGDKIPCIPHGPKVRTKRVVAYTKGFFSSGVNGFGFLLLSPYKIANNYTALDTNAPIRFTTPSFTGSTFAFPSAGLVETAQFATPYAVAENPSFRVVSAGLRIQCLAAPLYMNGQLNFCQLPNITDTWTARNIVDMQTAFTESIVTRVDPTMRTFVWRFGSNVPQAVVSEQQEFMQMNNMTGYQGHNLGVSLTGATGSGSGITYQWEAIVIFEVADYYNSLSGTRLQSPDAINTDTSNIAQEVGPQFIEKARGEVTKIDYESVINHVLKTHDKVKQAKETVSQVSQLVDHLKVAGMM